MRITGSVTMEDLDAGFSRQLAGNKAEIDAFIKDVAGRVRDSAKQTAAFIDKTGNLRRSIGMRKSKFIDGGYIVKATGRNRSDDKGYHAGLVEFGHAKVLWGRRTNGRVPPHPFMRPALAKGSAYAASKINGMKGSK